MYYIKKLSYCREIMWSYSLFGNVATRKNLQKVAQLLLLYQSAHCL